MNILQIVQLILTLGAQLVPELTKSDIPADVIADAKAGLAKFASVQGSLVTFGQLEGLRLAPAWPDAGAPSTTGTASATAAAPATTTPHTPTT